MKNNFKVKEIFKKASKAIDFIFRRVNFKRIINSPEFKGLAAMIVICCPSHSVIIPILEYISLQIESNLSPKIKARRELISDIRNCTESAINLLSKNESSIDNIRNRIETILEQNEDEPTRNTVQNIVIELYNSLSNNEKEDMELKFKKAFNECLYLHPNLSAQLEHHKLDSVENQNSFFCHNEFINKLDVQYENDGMIRALKTLFLNHCIKANIAIDLSRIMNIYNRVYEQYNNDTSWNPGMSRDLDEILKKDAINTFREDQNIDPYVRAFIKFIDADCLYFQGNFSEAIKKYEELKVIFDNIFNMSKKNDLSENIFNDIKNYLDNSIGWSYCKANNVKKGKEILKNLCENIRENSTFAWRYRRNYGVSLERNNEFKKAIEQYELVISDISKNSSGNPNNLPNDRKDYKLYINYCSAMMKLWDEKCGKTDPIMKWAIQAKKFMENNDSDICQKNINKITNYLDLAEKKAPNIMLNLILNQKIKLKTYMIFFSEDDKKRNKLINEVEGDLSKIETLDCNNRGKIFIKRDFYYALWLTEKNDAKKDDWYDKSKESNSRLNGSGDAQKFDIIFSSK